MQGTLAFPCCVCGTRESTPFKYLLHCSQCRRGYHHRCCKPPVHDAVLTSLIRATEKKKPGKGLSAWVCMSCSAGGGSRRTLRRDPSSSSTVASAINAVSETERRKQAIVHAAQPEMISILDSDDGESEVIAPPTTKQNTPSRGSIDKGTSEVGDARLSVRSGEVARISEESYDGMDVDHHQIPVTNLSVPIPRSPFPSQQTSSIANVHTKSVTRTLSSEARNLPSSRWASLSIPPQSRPITPSSLHFPASSGFVSMKTFATWPKVARPLQVKIDKDESKLPFDDEKLKDLPRPPMPPKAQGRQPRKVPAKKLDRHNKSPGQRAFTFITED